ncbi:MAG: flagellin [Candidatus Krumholzibacteriia bacterium]
MGIRINTNVASLNTQRHLFNATIRQGKSVEKLASGLRINRAADDAAGLAISEGMRSDIRALDQAARNAADGISLVQTAEGALDEVSGILLRMKELAEQSLGGTLSAAQQDYLDAEYQELSGEIDRVSAASRYNGIALLDGTLDVDIQVGIDTGVPSTISISLATATSAAGLAITESIGAAGDPAAALDEVDAAIATLSGVRATFGADQNRLESSVRNILNRSENTAAANSRIRGVDVAAETSAMTSFKILQQAGVTVLSQTNQSPRLAMSLLQ